MSRCRAAAGWRCSCRLKLTENGVLQTQAGHSVVGEGGPISIPPGMQLTIAKDGTISGIPSGEPANAVVVLGRLKLVNPPEQNLARGGDGLFRLKDGGQADADAAVQVAGGALEGSNVSVVDAMVNMISLARQFETHMSLLKNAESNDTKATQLMALS